VNLPSPVNDVVAAAAVRHFFTVEDWVRRASEYGWVLSMIDPLVVIVEMRAANHDDGEYTIRLSCGYYPTHPPDAMFVNPATLQYNYGEDNRHVAKLEAPYCHTHLSYNFQPPYEFGPQLVCSSMTLGYYFSNHTPTEDQVWRPGYHDIGSTLYAIHRAMRSLHYKGRHV
jgi:hypothetical protein